MAETPVHRDRMIDLIEIFKDRYIANPNVYVSGNMFLYYERGNKRKHVSPDVFVALGVPKEPERDCYFLWNEPKGPDVVFEITSSSTMDEDLERKYNFYLTKLKVPEYFLFDPHADYLPQQLEGYRMVGDRYEPILPVAGRWESRSLGVDLEPRGRHLWVYDGATGERLLTPRAQRDLAIQRAETAESEAELLRQEIERLKNRNA